MHKAKIVIALLVLLSVAVAAVYGIWMLLSFYFPQVLFYGYVGVGAIASIIIIFFSVKNTSGSFINVDQKNAALLPFFAQINSSKVKKLRLRIGQFFDGLSTGLTFPAFIVQNRSKVRAISTDNQRGLALKAIGYDLINGVQLASMLVSLLLLVVASAFYFLNKSEWATSWAIVSILSVAFLMLSAVISGASLPKIFKLQLGNPFIRFFIYGVAAATVFMTSMLIIKASIYQSAIDGGLIIATAKNLFSPAQIFNNAISPNAYSILPLSELLLAALFYITIATSLFRWRDFVRSEDDVNIIAQNMVILGQYTKSMDWMDSGRVINSKLRLTKAMALLSINRIDQGLAEIEKGITDESLKGIDAYSGAIFAGLQYCLPSRVNRKILDKWLNSKPDESLLLMVLQSASLVFSEEELMQIELDTRIRSRPIHHAMLLLSMNRHAEMEKALEGSTPGSELEEIIRLIFLLPKGITPETTLQEDHLHIHSWLDNQLPLIESYTRELTELELLVIVMVLMLAIGFVRLAKVSREDEILYLRNELRARITLTDKNTLLATILNEQEKQLLA